MSFLAQIKKELLFALFFSSAIIKNEKEVKALASKLKYLETRMASATPWSKKTAYL